VIKKSNALRQLEACGQSVWTDVISRQMIRSGTLQRYIDEDGISGVTANPSIFEHAIVSTHDYDDTIRTLGSQGHTPLEIYEALALEDVAAAADLLRPIYDRTAGTDGFVSIEVSPELAHQIETTLAEARRFWSKLDRPNIMIKVPAIVEGIPAIEQLTAEGINVNITLIFSVEVYKQVVDAHLKGLEQRINRGLPIDRVASVASFFVSRVDTMISPLLARKARDVDEQARTTLERLEGKVAIANAKIAYQWFEQVFGSDRFKRLAGQGAQRQRPLWASTSTKNPAYSDTLYVASLIGPHTVNTMTLDTIEAFRDHGAVECDAVRQGVEQARQELDDLRTAGISIEMVTDRLAAEGIEKFSGALRTLLTTIQEREGTLARI